MFASDFDRYDPPFGTQAGDHCYLRPVGRVAGAAAEAARESGFALASGRKGEAWPFVETITRRAGAKARRRLWPVDPFHRWLDRAAATPLGQGFAQRLTALTAPRPDWAGLSLDRPLVMGILNVTPDSFSDGGRFLDPAAAIAAGRAMAAAGADILDIGGESTRPGAAPVDPPDEIARICPVITALAAAGLVVSVDTRHADVMLAAVAAGARIINDVAGLTGPGSLQAVARLGVPAVLMHMQGEPQSMQASPSYDDVLLDVADYLDARLAECRAAGIPATRLLLDPGIGFGKTQVHNLALMAGLGLLRGAGSGLLLGVSRKGMIGALTGVANPADRVMGSVAAAQSGILRGADILRVHDVAATVEALRVMSVLEAES